jgi:hypothetical protein
LMWLDQVIDEGRHVTRLHSDLPFFAENALKLRPKFGPLEPFKFNAAQHKLHALLEEQRKRTGRLRAIILKGRQVGCSTYIAGRFFHKTISTPGIRTFILGHERRASSNLFGIVKRFFDGLPEDMRPSVGASNAEELIFSAIDAGYLVATATTEGAGRSATAQLLHGSECAYWPDLNLQLAALLQTIPDRDGTEVLLESTACGFNQFYELWRRAEAGETEWLPVFLPWFLDKGYRRKADDFEMDGEERLFAELHRLDAEQMAWRRAKINQLGNPELFRQEYPSLPSEAFISSTFDSFIPGELVVKARREQVEPYGDLIVGVDPASATGDRSAIAWRRGHAITKVKGYRGLDLMQLTGLIGKIIKEDRPARVALDVGGLGIGVYDRLRELGHSRSLILPVNFGGKAVEVPALDETGTPAVGYANRRAEIWANMRAALEEGRFSIPDDDALQSDLVSCRYSYRSDGRLLLESKEQMRKRGLPSPDLADACALTFCEPHGSGVVRGKSFNRDLRDRYANLYV